MRLCDNTNVIAKIGSITGIEQRPTASKFDTETLEMVFEESSKIFFRKSIHIFLKYFSKENFFEFCTRFFFYFTISFEQMIPYLFRFLLLFKRSSFHIGIFISCVAMLQFKNCLSV